MDNKKLAETAQELIRALGINWEAKWEGEDEGIVLLLEGDEYGFAGIFPPTDEEPGYLPYTCHEDYSWQDGPDWHVAELGVQDTLTAAIACILQAFMDDAMVAISERDMVAEWDKLHKEQK